MLLLWVERDLRARSAVEQASFMVIAVTRPVPARVPAPARRPWPYRRRWPARRANFQNKPVGAKGQPPGFAPRTTAPIPVTRRDDAAGQQSGHDKSPATIHLHR